MISQTTYYLQGIVGLSKTLDIRSFRCYQLMCEKKTSAKHLRYSFKQQNIHPAESTNHAFAQLQKPIPGTQHDVRLPLNCEGCT
jgi:hypothetical protein